MATRLFNQVMFLVLGLGLGLSVGLEMKAIVVAIVGVIVSYTTPRVRLAVLSLAAIGFIITVHFHPRINGAWGAVAALLWLIAIVHTIDQYHEALGRQQAPESPTVLQ